jgi:nicotinamidase/pyrazinamidase
MRALLLVDIQNDFLPGGALAVPRGDEVIDVANRLAKRFNLVLATQDWHPAVHGSFASQHAGQSVGDVIDLNGLDQILWPDHCIQNTPGVAFAPDLHTDRFERVFFKGTDREVDSYSAFYDNAHRNSTGLAEFLNNRGMDEIYIAGLATDYCVKATALDGRSEGLQVTVILDGIRGVEVKPGDVDGAVDQMRAAGVQLVRETEVMGDGTPCG